LQNNLPSDDWKLFIEEVNSSLQKMGAAKITDAELEALLKDDSNFLSKEKLETFFLFSILTSFSCA
jgi:hypothetical protein